MKYKNYRNSYTNEDTIYSSKNIADMSVREAFSRKDEIMAQHNSIGIPTEGELKSSPNAVWVEAYTREDETEVRAHWRSKPDGNANNNFSHGNPTGGASEVNNVDNIFSEKMNNANDVLSQDFTSAINNIDKQNSETIYENLLINPIELSKYRKQKEHVKEAEKLRPPIKIDNNSITSPFGMRYHPIHKKYIGHKGIDLKCKAGTDVRASLPGIVETAENQKGYGYVVIINHGLINGKELKTKYAHLSKFDVVKGMKVNSQQKIGLSGGIPGTLGAGSSTGAHLHFEVLEDSIPVDPVKYFKNE